MNMTRMMLKVRVNSSALKRILVDLTGKDLVEQNTLRRKTVYAATPKARTILSHLKEFSRIFPITEIAPTSYHIDQCRAISQQEQPPFEQPTSGAS